MSDYINKSRLSTIKVACLSYIRLFILLCIPMVSHAQSLSNISDDTVAEVADLLDKGVISLNCWDDSGCGKDYECVGHKMGTCSGTESIRLNCSNHTPRPTTDAEACGRNSNKVCEGEVAGTCQKRKIKASEHDIAELEH
jgi:hypothetical protein